MKDLKAIKVLLTGILLVLIGMSFFALGAEVLGPILFGIGIIVFIIGLFIKPQKPQE